MRVGLKDKEVRNKYYGKIIGSEGCVIKLEKDLDSLILGKYESEKEIRILSPPIPDVFINSIYEKIEKITVSFSVKIVFNDFGFLFKCHELILMEKIIPILGRVLTKSFSDCPWHEKLLMNESFQIKRMFGGNNFEDTNKLMFLKQFKIKEIEVNANNNINTKYFKEIEISLTTYFKNHLLAIQRECPIARIEKEFPPECYNKKICDSLYICRMKLNGENILVDKNFEVYIKDNCIYREIENIDYEKYNIVIC